ncbi:MAG: cobalt ECF transporter T component CbiQ [Magnetospirillum sp.]|nr:cobalt ECF transporter T component CbiQ [Magnetospirillum sp.]
MTALDRIAHAGRWRRLPLAEKALLALGLLALALILPPWPGAVLVLAAAALAALAGARVPPGAWLGAFAAPAAFIATGALALVVTWGEDGLALVAEPLVAVRPALRALAATAALLLLALTTPAPVLVKALRLPPELADLALALYRFLFGLLDTLRAMQAAQQARLGGAGSIRSAGLLAAALLPRALERARRLEIGLAARLHTGTLDTLAAEPAPSPRRLAAIAILLAAVAGGAAWLQ